VNSRLGPVSELTKRPPLQPRLMGRPVAHVVCPRAVGPGLGDAGVASRPARENVTHAPAVHSRGWQTGRAPPELLDLPPLVALEGDYAAWRTVGSDPSPDQPSGEARRVVPRAPRDGARRRPRGQSATGDGAAHLPPDPPVSAHDVVRREPAPQCAAPAGELGGDLRRLPELQRPGVARPARGPTGVPAVQRAVCRRVGGFGAMCVRSSGTRRGGPRYQLAAASWRAERRSSPERRTIPERRSLPLRCSTSGGSCSRRRSRTMRRPRFCRRSKLRRRIMARSSPLTHEPVRTAAYPVLRSVPPRPASRLARGRNNL